MCSVRPLSLDCHFCRGPADIHAGMAACLKGPLRMLVTWSCTAEACSMLIGILVLSMHAGQHAMCVHGSLVPAASSMLQLQDPALRNFGST